MCLSLANNIVFPSINIGGEMNIRWEEYKIYYLTVPFLLFPLNISFASHPQVTIHLQHRQQLLKRKITRYYPSLERFLFIL